MRDAYDPSEARNERGEWMSGGAAFQRGNLVRVRKEHVAKYGHLPKLRGMVGLVSSTIIGAAGVRHFVKFDEPLDTAGAKGAPFPAEHLERATVIVKKPDIQAEFRKALRSRR